MNKVNARKIAEVVTNEQLCKMIDLARDGVTKWDAVSVVNKGITKGVAWNILCSSFDTTVEHHFMVKLNMVREFGEFIEGEFELPRRERKGVVKPFHQEPVGVKRFEEK